MNNLPKELQEHTYFAELNKEFGKYDNINKKYYFYDFTITNIKYCLEFNGNYYHANPELYNEIFFNKHLKLTAKEIREKEKIKLNLLIDQGFKIDICWENTEDKLYNTILNNILDLFKFN